ncbi:MAG: PHP domain-containing protein [Planctomycetaceae bacterium]
MSGLGNKEIAGVFREIETLLQVVEGDPQRALSYGRAARTIETLPESAADLAARGRLGEVRGMGPKLQAVVAELLASGSVRLVQELLAKAPPGLPEMLKIAGLGPKRLHAVVHDLRAQTVEELRAAAQDGRLAEIKGFGAKTARKILEGIEFLESSRGQVLLPDAWALAERWREELHLPDAALAGPARRGCPVVDRIVLVAIGRPGNASIENARREGDAWIVRRRNEPLFRLRFAAADDFARTLFEETGPQEHVAEVLRIPGSAATEEEIYSSRALHAIPAEQRHACDGRTAPPRLVERDDLLGLVHAHTTWSDGTLDLGAMAAAAEERGFAYLAVTDHSRAAAYANGLSIERLRAQAAEVAKHNAGGGVRILHGAEVDILADGLLDYPDDVLAELDFVIASVHSSFAQDAETVTRRIEKAVRHPKVSILGHPTGRLLLRREGYPVDLERILAAAAETGCAVELNANPSRLDLDPQWHARARDLRLRIPIGPDAHSAEGMDDLVWGLLAARHGGLQAEDVPNCLDADGFLAALAR